jgi:hypothetical protein
MIKEKVTREDIELYEILRHPVLCGEFIHNMVGEFEFTDYQKEILCDFNDHVAVCTARAVGKTVSLVSLILWALVYNLFPNDYILYAVPSKVHLQPVWEGLMRAFKTNPFLKNFTYKNEGINSSEYSIRLQNSASLLCRIAGQSGTGSNLVGLHTPFILVDEGGYFPWNAFIEMQPDLNTPTFGHREVVCGVPTGLREKNTLYHVDRENAIYTKHRVSSFQNPRLTEKDFEKFREQYGGEGSDDWVHYVLGEHGKPVYSLFDRFAFTMESYPVTRLEIDGVKENELGAMLAKIQAFPQIPKNYGVVLGVDLGYTEPTAIILLYLDEKERLRFHGRIKLTKVPYNVQEKIIDQIDTRFAPSIIGMDRGNAGISIIQNLQNHSDYASKKYNERLIPIDFSSSITVSKGPDGTEERVKTKVFTVSLLQEYSNSGRLVYSSTDPDMMAELERMTYTKNINGDIVYKTLTERGGKRGEDHFTSALLCGVGAFHLVREFNLQTPRKKLVGSFWVY